MNISQALLFITFCIFSSGCSSDIMQDLADARLVDLEPIAIHSLEISDPSGLTLDVSGDFLWTVSDDSGDFIYRINFEGEMLEIITGYRGDDMEGITMNPNDGTLWIVEERLRQIVQLTTDGEVLQSVDVPVDSTNLNDGLEGIAWNPQNDHVYILNEKNPRRFIELNAEFELVRSVTIDFDPPHDMSDLSGLFYLHDDEEFWFVSDESKKIVVTNIHLNPIRGYRLDREKFEGIAVDRSNHRLYLVNDEEDKLYTFELPG
ncbi:hypothetical protein DYD21_18885 [Rhodohalobacter sp. SW132]|uniref:SdiA-regulated domain-containing protein n=1 Tax=Rhodohalobacter sp. SW132 TaxID=2293433 RepID=UPI000E271AB5|nr:SdiA-regulated domain-containing protein [Rhodohalobacter sp. SW132]REL24276.1 hypothetical protein DYD21_18885 [Rhodohalobacter sp. SW132]